MSLTEIRISGGTASGRVVAGQSVCAALAGRITFPDAATSWDGDVWVIRCSCDDAACLRDIAVDGFTVTVDGVEVEASADAELADVVTAPKKKVRKLATPGR